MDHFRFSMSSLRLLYKILALPTITNLLQCNHIFDIFTELKLLRRHLRVFPLGLCPRLFSNTLRHVLRVQSFFINYWGSFGPWTGLHAFPNPWMFPEFSTIIFLVFDCLVSEVLGMRRYLGRSWMKLWFQSVMDGLTNKLE